MLAPQPLTLFVLVAAILIAIPSLLRTLWELFDARRKAEVEYENARTRATALRAVNHQSKRA